MRPHGVCTQAQCRLMSEKIITPDVITFHGGGGWWDVLGANLDTERRAERGEEAAHAKPSIPISLSGFFNHRRRVFYKFRTGFKETSLPTAEHCFEMISFHRASDFFSLLFLSAS